MMTARVEFEMGPRAASSRTYCGGRSNARRACLWRRRRPPRCGEIGLGAVPFDPAIAHLVLGEAFLQGRLGGVLEVGTNGGAHRGRRRGQVGDAGEGARLLPPAVNRGNLLLFT
jgi:hypothetical protein